MTAIVSAEILLSSGIFVKSTDPDAGQAAERRAEAEQIRLPGSMVFCSVFAIGIADLIQGGSEGCGNGLSRAFQGFLFRTVPLEHTAAGGC